MLKKDLGLCAGCVLAVLVPGLQARMVHLAGNSGGNSTAERGKSLVCPEEQAAHR